MRSFTRQIPRSLPVIRHGTANPPRSFILFARILAVRFISDKVFDITGKETVVGKMRPLPYRGRSHGTFEEEWGIHKGCSDWWYATGYVTDEVGRMYSFQFTLLRLRISVLRPYVVMLALTDFQDGKHYYFQRMTLSPGGVRIESDAVGFGGIASVEKSPEGLLFKTRSADFALDLLLRYGKGAVWHCDNGFLRMGIDHPKQSTIYYSYTNMPTTGTLTVHGQKKTVSGKSWFDKQGGPYAIRNRWCMWEWFSLRFFDDEEMMLFSFPQDGYRDGTYVRRDGTASRLNEYSITPVDFVYPDGRTKYSSGWKVSVPGLKDESYTITPLLKGQMNMGYYELLAGINAPDGARVGLCFVELLPGVYNTKFPDTALRNIG